jgi:amino acid transporter
MVVSARLRVLNPIQIFALSFGCIIGSGWVVVLGEWLRACGPAGVACGMLAGGAIMLANSGAYAELIARFPVAGGEFTFVRQVFGDRAAFMVGWLWTLSLLAVVAFEATALPWLLEALVPPLRGPVLYTSLNVPVSADALAIGLGGTIVIAVLNYRGIRSAATLQSVLAIAFMGLAIVIVAAGIALGSWHNAEPLVSGAGGRPWWMGSLWIFAITPFFLNGFQSVAQTVEERGTRVTFASIARTMALAIVIAVGFYCLITFAAASASPWQSLIDRPLATAAAFEALLPGRVLAILVLTAATLSVVRVWNGAAIWATRLLLAQARSGFLPATIATVHPRTGAPVGAVMFVAICNALGVLAGKGAIIPLVDMASLCLACNLFLVCITALRARAAGTAAMPYRTPGGVLTLSVALAGSAAMAGFAVLDPLLSHPGRIPLEWLVTALWSALGVGFWWGFARNHRRAGFRRTMEPSP